MNMRVERKRYLDHKIDISCIILSNLNDSFVKQRIIPSIIENSKSHSIEIIVVDNSSTQDFECNNVKYDDEILGSHLHYVKSEIKKTDYNFMDYVPHSILEKYGDLNSYYFQLINN